MTKIFPASVAFSVRHNGGRQRKRDPARQSEGYEDGEKDNHEPMLKELHRCVQYRELVACLEN